MNNLPFRKPGRFYRGNLHTHSNRSDGELPPEEVIAAYRAQGYDFLALTDHFLPQYNFPITDTRAFRDARFTTLPGAELHAPQTSAGRLWHIIAVGLPDDFAPPTPDETGPALAARAAAAGAFVGIAHPAWYTLTLDDGLSIEAAHAVEVFNATSVWDNDRGDGWYFCDMLLARGRRLLAYAADDAHFSIRPDTFVGWVEVRAEELSPEAILSRESLSGTAVTFTIRRGNGHYGGSHERIAAHYQDCPARLSKPSRSTPARSCTIAQSHRCTSDASQRPCGFWQNHGDAGGDRHAAEAC